MSIDVVDQLALGTSLRIVVSDPERLDVATAAVEGVVRAIDETCSRFREDSEISALHRNAGRETQVSPLLMLALRAAMRGARLSGGAVDPTVGTAVRTIGYDADFGKVLENGAPLRLVVMPVPGWQHIRLDEARRTAFVPEGVELDLGSTAIAVAGEAPQGGWVIQASDSSDDPVVEGAETIAIRAGGVATSSSTVRCWWRGGVALHHIVDPATGLPAVGPWRTVSVVAADCLDANIAATAAIVQGETALDWLQRLCLPARLVTHDGDVVRVAGWPAPDVVA
jgi:thiamine biosynthesis lipoprotein ApbE